MPAPAPAAVERHPHLAEPLAPGWVRVDLHSHTMWSGDSTTTAEELEEAVVASGLDVLCITDHNAVKGARSWPAGCRAAWSSGRSCGRTRARSSGCS